jgi:hypothetical protein
VKGPVIPDRRTAIVAGAGCLVLGSFLLYDAFDARGRRRPFWLYLLPGA